MQLDSRSCHDAVTLPLARKAWILKPRATFRTAILGPFGTAFVMRYLTPCEVLLPSATDQRINGPVEVSLEKSKSQVRYRSPSRLKSSGRSGPGVNLIIRREKGCSIFPIETSSGILSLSVLLLRSLQCFSPGAVDAPCVSSRAFQ